jgi:ribosomal protein S24E
MVKKVKFNPQSIIDEQVVSIDEALERIELRMKPYAKLAEKKNQLLSARRALLGGNRTTGAGGTRVTLEDVTDYLKEHPGSVVSSIAERFGVTQSTVSSHIYRNKDRFIKKEGRYFLRDPEAGIDTADDIEEDE